MIGIVPAPDNCQVIVTSFLAVLTVQPSVAVATVPPNAAAVVTDPVLSGALAGAN